MATLCLQRIVQMKRINGVVVALPEIIKKLTRKSINTKKNPNKGELLGFLGFIGLFCIGTVYGVTGVNIQ